MSRKGLYKNSTTVKPSFLSYPTDGDPAALMKTGMGAAQAAIDVLSGKRDKNDNKPYKQQIEQDSQKYEPYAKKTQSDWQRGTSKRKMTQNKSNVDQNKKVIRNAFNKMR